MLLMCDELSGNGLFGMHISWKVGKLERLKPQLKKAR